jgi:uncharacterized protein YcfL
MKKTLLIAAAALAAGIISTQAQVYSQNVVGYVNVVFPAGFTAVGSPFNNADGINSATNVLQNVPDFTYLYVWNTNAFTYDTYLAYGGEYYDGGGNNVVPTPNLPVGLGCFVQPPQTFTNTFVGTVNLTLGAPGTKSTNTVTLASGFNFVNPQIPIAGGVSSVMQMVPPDFTYFYVWNVANQNYEIAISYQGSWYDAAAENLVSEPTVSVASAFFVQPPSSFTWSIVYTNQ